MNFSKLKEAWMGILTFLLGIDPGFVALYHKLRFPLPKDSIPYRINELAKETKGFRFLQIGGNDGFINDPIFKFIKRYGWEGIIVEPQKHVFKNRLSRTHRLSSKVHLENIAIDAETGEKKLYKLSFGDDRWASGLASFDKSTLQHQIDRGYVARQAKRHRIKLPDDKNSFITHEIVPCMTISDLLDKHNFDHIHLLQIDTEGYDFELIKTIDFQRVTPSLISFEKAHLSEEDMMACTRLLESKGYELMIINKDALAIHKG